MISPYNVEADRPSPFNTPQLYTYGDNYHCMTTITELATDRAGWPTQLVVNKMQYRKWLHYSLSDGKILCYTKYINYH